MAQRATTRGWLHPEGREDPSNLRDSRGQTSLPFWLFRGFTPRYVRLVIVSYIKQVLELPLAFFGYDSLGLNGP